MSRPLGRAAAVLLAVALAGCGTQSPSAGSSPQAVDSPSSSASSSASEPVDAPPTGVPAPLTGVQVAPAVATRPVVAVAVVLGGGAPAPKGVAAADVVYQEMASSSGSRLVALFQSKEPATVGAVGPTSPVDRRLLSLLHPVFGFNGGPTGFVRQVTADYVVPRNAVVVPVLFPAGSGGAAPYDRVTSVAALRASAKDAPPAAAGLLDFTTATNASPAAAAPASRLTVRMPGHGTVTFRRSSAGWVAPAGATVANVVVQVVPYKRIVTSKGQQIDSANVLGRGPATVAAGAVAVRGSWSRAAVRGVTNYADGKGTPVPLRPGATWVLLAPTGTVVTVS